MQRIVLLPTLRLATQTRNSIRFQRRWVHQDVSNSQRGNEVKAPNIREYQSAPINISHFRALIQQPDAPARKRYRLRWDWHLRNFLMALMPPAALLIFIKLIEWRLGGDREKYEHLFPKDGFFKSLSSKKGTDADEISNSADIEGGLKASLNVSLVDRLERLEQEIDQLRAQRSTVKDDSSGQKEAIDGAGQDALVKARKLSRTIARHGRNPS